MANSTREKTDSTETRQFAAVTGASSGIGYELAKQFAINGFDLIVVADDEGIFDASLEFEKLGAEVTAVHSDLSKPKGVNAFYQAVVDMGRPLDAAALNAGVGVNGAFIDVDIKDLIEMVNLNVTSTMNLAQLIAKDMAKRGEGRILFTSSVAATTPGPYMAIYHATKAFVQSMAEGIRVELADKGVSVTALMPGATETNFFARAGAEDTELGQSEKDSAEDVARQGFEAMMAGKDHIVGGSWKNGVEVTLGKVIPESVKAKQAAKAAEPGSAKKH